jgi:hypothetical protein
MNHILLKVTYFGMHFFIQTYCQYLMRRNSVDYKA